MATSWHLSCWTRRPRLTTDVATSKSRFPVRLMVSMSASKPSTALKKCFRASIRGAEVCQPELRSFRTALVDGQLVEQAVVFIPDGKLGYFLRQIEQYLATIDRENPRHARLIDRIQSIGLASLEQLWTDPADFPTDDSPIWWEVWLRRRDGHEAMRFRQFGDAVGVDIGSEALGFADRTVILVRATASQLSRALDVLDDIAELRRPREPAGLIALEAAADQAEWAEQLGDRINEASKDSPAAVV